MRPRPTTFAFAKSISGISERSISGSLLGLRGSVVLAFEFRRSPRADDALAVRPIDDDDEEDALFCRETKDLEAVFARRVVGDEDGAWVGDGGGRLFERDAELLEVDCCFLIVPLEVAELDGVSGTTLRRANIDSSEYSPLVLACPPPEAARQGPLAPWSAEPVSSRIGVDPQLYLAGSMIDAERSYAWLSSGTGGTGDRPAAQPALRLIVRPGPLASGIVRSPPPRAARRSCDLAWHVP
jgi:hypothetical protein